MTTISARNFNVKLHLATDAGPRAARRVIVNADLLKSVKVSAGDVLAISKAGSPHTTKDKVRIRARRNGGGIISLVVHCSYDLNLANGWYSLLTVSFQ